MPEAFSHDEVSAYREHLLAKFEAGDGSADYSGDLFANQATESFIGDGRLLEASRDLLDGELVYFGGSSAM